MDLGDGSSVRLTVSRYYTPTGRSIQKPYDKENGASYYNDRLIRFHNGELTNGDSIKVNDSLKFITPKGKVVYGGGGIVPDVFVGIDTTAYFNGIDFQKINNFVFDYAIDTHREQVKKWTFKTFKSDFDKDEVILNQYFSLIDKNTRINSLNTPFVKLYLKALFARILYGENAFYEMLNQNDKMLEKVLALESQVEISDFKD